MSRHNDCQMHQSQPTAPGRWEGGGQGGCEQRIEVIVNMIKKIGVGFGRGGVRVDLNEELKLL